MKEIPILFTADMVLAKMAGRKTMTRRLNGLDMVNEWPSSWVVDNNKLSIDQKGRLVFRFWNSNDGRQVDIPCPYGRLGTLLWVRENFRVNNWYCEDGELNFRFEADGSISDIISFDDLEGETFLRYWEQSCDDLEKAGYQMNDEERYVDYDYKALRLRPNIFMPKAAARIWLQVTDIRVERLQDINPSDVTAEGIGESFRSGAKSMASASIDHNLWSSKQIRLFKDLWGSINGPESWEASPWVWVISFDVLSTTGKPDYKTEKTTA